MEAKGFAGQSSEAPLTEEEILNSTPLFEAFDPETEGGLGVTQEGQLFEVRHLKWSDEGQGDIVNRTSKFPIWVNRYGLNYGERITDMNLTSTNKKLDNEVPTLGQEVEFSLQDDNSNWHYITKDGSQFFRRDGTSQKWHSITDPNGKNYAVTSKNNTTEVNIDPEAFKFMAEFKTAISYGAEDLRFNLTIAAAAIEDWMQEEGFTSPNNTVHPHEICQNDITEQWYIGVTTDEIRSIREFAVLSGQLHIQAITPQAGQHATNKYQKYQALFGLLTAAGPARNGSLSTTIGEHYQTVGHEDTDDDNVLPLPSIEGYPILYKNQDLIPDDWREPARTLGSKSAGVITRAAPIHLHEYLRAADRSQRNGSNISIVRELGWHSDRQRLDKVTIEICNLGTAGGNLNKLSAVDEIVSKYIIAEQLRYLNMTPMERFAEKQRYQDEVDAGNKNNFNASLYGKKALFEVGVKDKNKKEVLLTPREMLDEMIANINQHSLEPISDEAKLEAYATLEEDNNEYGTVEEVFEAAFQPHSSLRFNDAMRKAEKLEPNTSVDELYKRWGLEKRKHIYGERAHYVSKQRKHIGNLALSNQS